MSRSNGPNLSTGGRPAPRSQASDPHWQGQPQYQPAHGQPQQPNAGHYQQGYAPAQPNSDALASLAGYRYPQQAAAPQQGHDDPYARQQPAPGYGQQHDPYAAYAPQQANNGYGNGYVAEPGPSPLTQGYPAGHQDLRGPSYDQWPQQAHGQQGYDNGYGRQQPQNGYPQRQAAPQLSANDWSGNDPYAAHSADPGFDLAGYGGPQASYDGYQQQQSGALVQQYADEEDDDDVEPPRRGRGRMIIMALVGAIGIGGGLAYGYKELLGGPSASDSAPVVKSAAGPTKTKPTNPGGKQFAHADSKVLGRLGDNGSSAADDGAQGRKVSTLSIGRDGTIMVPTASASEASSPAPTQSSGPSVNVPGLMVVDAYGRGNQASAASSSSPTADKPLVVNPPAAAPEKPVVIAKATPSSRTATDAVDAAPDPAPAPPARKKSQPPVEKTAMNVGAPPPPPATTGSAGYVAVLASVPASGTSRMQALKQFADMQQKYGSVLQNKTPDVQEANLGDKGTYHRLLVGPPASRDQASSLCSSLKAAGYNDCWVTGY